METPAPEKNNLNSSSPGVQIVLPGDLVAALFKVGYKTTQFWLALIALALLNVELFTSALPSQWAQALAVVANVVLPYLYQTLRNTQIGDHRDAILDHIVQTEPSPLLAVAEALRAGKIAVAPSTAAAPVATAPVQPASPAEAAPAPASHADHILQPITAPVEPPPSNIIPFSKEP